MKPKSDLAGAFYHGSDGAITCALCDCEMEWEQCGEIGCEDGACDAFEDDPIWNNPGDTEACPMCNGKGGTWWCENKECQTMQATRLITKA